MPIDGWDDRIDTPEEHRSGMGTIQIDVSSLTEARYRIREVIRHLPDGYPPSLTAPASETLRGDAEEMANTYGVAEHSEPVEIDPDYPLSDDERQRLQQSFNEWVQKPPPVYVLIRTCDPIENFPPIYHDGELVEILAHGTLEEMRAHHKKGTFDSSGYVPCSSLEVD